jgi:hypothetical protein
MLTVITPNVIMMSVIITLNDAVVMFCHSVIMLRVVMLSFMVLGIIFLCIIMLVNWASSRVTLCEVPFCWYHYPECR